jgi:hypothetical protein
LNRKVVKAFDLWQLLHSFLVKVLGSLEETNVVTLAVRLEPSS